MAERTEEALAGADQPAAGGGQRRGYCLCRLASFKSSNTAGFKLWASMSMMTIILTAVLTLS